MSAYVLYVKDFTCYFYHFIFFPLHFFRQRTVTRGVNKGVKEDFRATMEKQISRSNEPIEKVIYQFLTEEKSLILANLLQV